MQGNTWMLSQFYDDPLLGTRAVCSAYSNGYDCPQHPGDCVSGWALVRCNSSTQQIEAAGQDPRVQPYRTLWDPITEETATAYAEKGAKSGMMLGQLVQILAQTDPGFCD